MDGRRRDGNYKLLGARAVVKRALLSLVTKYSLSKEKKCDLPVRAMCTR